MNTHTELDENQVEHELIEGEVYKFTREDKECIGTYKPNNHSFWLNGYHVGIVSCCKDIELFNNT